MAAKYLTKNDFLKIAANTNAFLSEKKAGIIQKFLAENDLPSQKDENWKKTSLKKILEHNYVPGEKIDLDKLIVSMYNISGLYANIAVFINGYYCPNLSKIIDKGLIVTDIYTAKKKYPEIFAEYFDKTDIYRTHWFAAFNTLYAPNGAFIMTEKNKAVENPVHVYFFTDGNNRKIITQTRNLLIASENSAANVLFSYHSLSSDFIFTNTATEIFIKNRANLNFNLFQGEGNEASQINTVKADIKNEATFKANTITMCGRLVRNDLHVVFNGNHSYCELNGMYMPDREQHFDNTIFVHHANPYNTSNQLYRGIVDNNASSVFYGKVLIDKGAIKSEAHQNNNNILLTPYAKAHSKPHLIIYNDDVAASHGSTTGQIDKEALYYMRTRGIGDRKARTLLLTAFVEEVLDKLNIEQFKLYTKILTEKRLSGEKIENQCAKLGICRY